MSTLFYYDMHDLLALRLHVFGAGHADYFRSRFDCFAASSPSRDADIDIHLGSFLHGAHTTAEFGEGCCRALVDTAGRRLARWQTRITGLDGPRTTIRFDGNWRATRYLFFNFLEPIINYRLAQDGACLVHAACFRINGRGVLVCGYEGSGKTTTLLNMLERGADYLSDEMTIITADGRAMSYPTPLSLQDYNMNRYLSRRLSGMQRFRTVLSKGVRILSAGRAKLATAVPPEQLLNGGRVIDNCPVDCCMILGESNPLVSPPQSILNSTAYQYRHFMGVLDRSAMRAESKAPFDYWNGTRRVVESFCERTATVMLDDPGKYERYVV